jgi:hypothetical protein
MKLLRMIPAALGILIPASGWACPACMVGDPKTASTYFGMTLVMSALPLLLIGGVSYWLWRRLS